MLARRPPKSCRRCWIRPAAALLLVCTSASASSPAAAAARQFTAACGLQHSFGRLYEPEPGGESQLILKYLQLHRDGHATPIERHRQLQTNSTDAAAGVGVEGHVEDAALIEALFEHFDEDGDGLLSIAEYAHHCRTTAGAGNESLTGDEKRAETECMGKLGVAADLRAENEGRLGMSLAPFAKLYAEPEPAPDEAAHIDLRRLRRKSDDGAGSRRRWSHSDAA